MRSFMLIAVALGSFDPTACGTPPPDTEEVSVDVSTADLPMRDFGENVFMISGKEAGLGMALAQFKKTHSELMIAAIGPIGGGQNQIHGYFVVAYPRNELICPPPAP